MLVMTLVILTMHDTLRMSLQPEIILRMRYQYQYDDVLLSALGMIKPLQQAPLDGEVLVSGHDRVICTIHDRTGGSPVRFIGVEMYG